MAEILNDLRTAATTLHVAIERADRNPGAISLLAPHRIPIGGTFGMGEVEGVVARGIDLVDDGTRDVPGSELRVALRETSGQRRLIYAAVGVKNDGEGYPNESLRLLVSDGSDRDLEEPGEHVYEPTLRDPRTYRVGPVGRTDWPIEALEVVLGDELSQMQDEEAREIIRNLTDLFTDASSRIANRRMPGVGSQGLRHAPPFVPLG